MTKTQESSAAGEADAADAQKNEEDDSRTTAKSLNRDGSVRSKTMSLKEMSREMRRGQQDVEPESQEDAEFLASMEAKRPKRRADCRTSARPCLFISCKHHLYLDVNPVTGSIKLNFPDKQVWELKETCALDVADRGGITLEEVGDIMNLTRERIRQVESRGLTKLRDVTEDDLDPGKSVR